MRQGNGSDLLGLKDLRSTKIGIIYVAPNDDRKSVLAAILTQEKLGRKQIAIVLPENQPNKAFQRPQDFDDLKDIRRKLHAQLIFVAPAGPGPAEFARQRRFSVYSSLGSYTDALRAEPSSAKGRKKEKKDRLFGFGKKTVPLARIATRGAVARALPGEKGPSVPIVSPDPINSVDKNMTNNSLSPYADIPTVDLGPQASQSGGSKDESLPVSEADQALSTPTTDMEGTISPSIARSSVVAAGDAAADLIKKDASQPVASDIASASVHEDWDALSPAPSASSSQTKAPAASITPDTTPSSTLSSAPDTPDPTTGEGPRIIELRPSSRAAGSRSTGKLPAVGAGAAATSTGQPSATFVPNASSQGRHTGKMAAVIGAKPAGSAPPRTTLGRLPLRSGKQAQPGTARKRPRSRGLILALLIVVLLLLCSGVAVSSPTLRQFHFNLPMVGNPPSATITITPNSKLEQGSYVIQAVTSNADPTKREVSLRQLTFSSQKQSKSVTATGHTQIPAKAATGQLTFYNGSDHDVVVSSTIPIPGPNGMSVLPDTSVNIPAAHPPTEGSITVSAHAITTGANGNITAGAIHEACCVSGGFITVVSSAFTGGQDEQNYTYLQQSDVDGVVNQIKPTQCQQALGGLKGQIKSNEQWANNSQCTVQSDVDQPIGDQGPDKKVTTANVTVSATYTGLAYDATGAQILAQGLLKRKAASDLGQGYVLAGTIMTKPIVTDTKDNVTLQVAVAGTWYYQFDDQQKLALAKQLVNKSRGVAQGLLNGSKGIAKASIDIADGGDTLPSDPKQINITVVGVSGASSANLPDQPVITPMSSSSATGGRG